MIRTLVTAALLFALNCAMCWRFFKIEYNLHWGSIEGAYVGLARYIRLHWPQLEWFPQWYGGIPFENTYPPLLHFMVAAVAAASGWSEAYAYHFTVGIFYALGGVTLYLLARVLFDDERIAVVTAVIASVCSPSAWLMNSVFWDLGGWADRGYSGARRMMALGVYGEGPQVSSMTLWYLAAALVILYVRAPSRRRLVWAAGAVAAVPLTNWIGAFTLATALLTWWITEPRWESAKRLALTGIFAYALAASWIPPSTIRDIQLNSKFTGGVFTWTGQNALAAAVTLVVAGFLAFISRRRSPGLRFALVFTFLTGALALTAEWAKLKIIPQPERYHLAMEIGIAMLAATGLVWIWDRAPLPVGVAVLVLFMSAAGWQVHQYRLFARTMLREEPAATRIEPATAREMQRRYPGERVYYTGSTQFWADAFGSNPQLRGGFDNGLTNQNLWAVNFGLPFTRGDGAITAEWFKAYNIRAVAVGGPNTRDAYRNFQDPAKFDGILREVWREGDDRIFEVTPHRYPGAYLIRREDEPRGPIYTTRLDSIASYLSSRQGLKASWTESAAVVECRGAPGSVISLPISYDRGWSATNGGHSLATRADALGQLLVDLPHGCLADRIALEYRSSLLWRTVSTAALIFALMSLVRNPGG